MSLKFYVKSKVRSYSSQQYEAEDDVEKTRYCGKCGVVLNLILT